MENLLKNLVVTRSLRAVAAVVTVALLALSPVSARANTITENIAVKGGTVVEQGDEVVITFTAAKIAADGAGTLTFNKGSAIARVLAVGGGGSGGLTTGLYNGGGGGGGAGGMVEELGNKDMGADLRAFYF